MAGKAFLAVGGLGDKVAGRKGMAVMPLPLPLPVVPLPPFSLIPPPPMDEEEDEEDMEEEEDESGAFQVLMCAPKLHVVTAVAMGRASCVSECPY